MQRWYNCARRAHVSLSARDATRTLALASTRASHASDDRMIPTAPHRSLPPIARTLTAQHAKSEKYTTEAGGGAEKAIEREGGREHGAQGERTASA